MNKGFKERLVLLKNYKQINIYKKFTLNDIFYKLAYIHQKLKIKSYFISIYLLINRYF